MILLNKARNYIINGALDFWQRGITFTSVSTGTYFADRFVYMKSGSMSHSLAKDADVPTLSQSGFFFPNSILATVSGAAASPTVSDYSGIEQKIEGNIVAPLLGKKIVLSFWIKSSITGTFPVAFRNGDNSRSYVSTYTISAANTWEKKTISLTLTNSGLWSTDTGIGLKVYLGFVGGTNVQAPLVNTWYSGNYLSVSGCTNGVASVGYTFRVTGLQLEEGTEASGFDRAGNNVLNELRLCQRYYEKSYDVDTVPGTVSTAGRHFISLTYDGTNFRVATFLVAKRQAPAIAYYDYDAAMNFFASTYINTKGVWANYTAGGYSRYYQWVADAEL